MNLQELEIRFTFHPPKRGQQAKYETIRERAFEFAIFLNTLCPDSREFSIALTKLDEVVMHANAAIARRE